MRQKDIEPRGRILPPASYCVDNHPITALLEKFQLILGGLCHLIQDIQLPFHSLYPQFILTLVSFRYIIEVIIWRNHNIPLIVFHFFPTSTLNHLFAPLIQLTSHHCLEVPTETIPPYNLTYMLKDPFSRCCII